MSYNSLYNYPHKFKTITVLCEGRRGRIEPQFSFLRGGQVIYTECVYDYDACLIFHPKDVSIVERIAQRLTDQSRLTLGRYGLPEMEPFAGRGYWTIQTNELASTTARRYLQTRGIAGADSEVDGTAPDVESAHSSAERTVKW